MANPDYQQNTNIMYLLAFWCPGPESNRYSLFKPTDFKSVVSTNFTTRAGIGGASQSRTGLTGFAIQGITDLLTHRASEKQKGKPDAFP